MNHHPTAIAVVVFLIFVGSVLGLSFYLGSKAKSAAGYYAAHGGVPWFINGIAFAGDYLSAASFLGICGMIAFYGYDGFLYSIGYLAGWVVALFVIAEPLKRLGRFTFADALDNKFNSRGIKLAAAISTLVVSLLYLIPQMVGAGALVKPLLGLEHYQGVLIVGAIVITIVVTAGMVSTTYVQFIKGSLLVIFCAILTVMILNRGFKTSIFVGGDMTAEWAKTPDDLVTVSHIPPPYPNLDDIFRLEAEKKDSLAIPQLETELRNALKTSSDKRKTLNDFNEKLKRTNPTVRGRALTKVPLSTAWDGKPYILVENVESGERHYFRLAQWPMETQSIEEKDGKKFVNGKIDGEIYAVGRVQLPDAQLETGPLGALEFFSKLSASTVEQWRKDVINDESNKTKTTIYYPVLAKGKDLLLPGNSPNFSGIKSDKLQDKLNFISLMLALFCGTASLPHILIRYYTVKDQASARKSTVVGIASIGFFYVLTFYLGIGAMTSGSIDPTDGNMSAPLLAKSFGALPFAVISAIAFTTVLGTVSGLIIAASGAVAHDLLTNFMGRNLNDHDKVRAGKIAAVVVGVLAMILGVIFKNFNVTFLVGWAFNVAASANLPALIMLLFWKGTTKQGITAGILAGLFSSLIWIMLSGDAYVNLYGLSSDVKPIAPFNQPGIVTIPLGFLVLIVVSLMTRRQTQPA